MAPLVSLVGFLGLRVLGISRVSQIGSVLLLLGDCETGSTMSRCPSPEGTLNTLHTTIPTCIQFSLSSAFDSP